MKQKIRMWGGQNSLLAFLFLFLLTLLPCKGWADGTYNESGLELTYTDEDVVGGVAITEIVSVPADGKVVIPSEIEGNPVVEIRSTYNANIKALVVPASVKIIGDGAFDNCSSLTSLTFAEGSQLKTIGESAFYYTGITSVKIPASVTEIKTNAFYGSKLTEVTFENGESLEIGNAAFGSNPISEVTLPKSLKSIGSQAFVGTDISEITIPKSVQSIGGQAFFFCSNLASVIVESETPCSLGDMAFSNDYDNGPKFTTDFHIIVPSGYETTYKENWSAYEQYISESTTGSEITDGNYTYELNADGENTVTLVKVESDGSSYDPISFPRTFEKDGTTYTVTQIGKGEKIFTGTRSISASADAIPNKVNTIGANAFDGIYFRDGAVIPASVKYIGGGAFATHYDETTVESSASSVTLKSNAAFEVGEKIFGEQVGYDFSISVSEDLLETFKTTKGWDTYKDYFITEFVDNGLRYRKYQNQEESHLTLVGFDEESTEAKDKVVVPAKVYDVPVTYIEKNAFMGKSTLTSLDLSQATNLKVINYYAFMQTSLTEVVIPANVTSICTAAFGKISTLKKVTLYPTDITQYDPSGNPYWRDQFSGCNNLEAVWVPKGTKSTYRNLFDTMANKDEIIKEMDNSIIVGDYTYELNEDGANTVTLVKFTVPQFSSDKLDVPATFEKDGKIYTVTQIGNGETINDSKYYQDAVADAIPNTVTKIDAHAFDGIHFRDGVIIPASVKSIGDAAFVTGYGTDYQTTVNSVTLKASEAFTVGEKIFGETTNLTEAGFVILTSSEDVANKFKQTTGWDTYKDYFITEIVKNGLRYRKNGDGTALTLMGFDEESADAKDKVVVPAVVDGIPVTAIGSKAFMSQSNLTSLDLSQAINLTQIGESAFGETGLTEVVIPAQVKTLGYSAFGYISSLTKATFERESGFEEGVNYSYAFERSNNLAEIYVPKDTKSSYTDIFKYSIENAEEKIKEIVKPISDDVYKYQLNDDGQTVTVVGIADGVTLKNEVWLRGLVESYEVTGIAANVFSNMPEISQIHIPSCVSTIAANAFSSMTSGLKVYFERTGDISGYSNEMFGTTQVSSINVPTEAYAAYYAQLTNDQEDEDKIGISSSLADGQGVDNLAQALYPEGELKYTRNITDEEKGGYITTCLPFVIDLSDAKYEGLFAGVWTFTPQVTYKADGRYYIDLQKIEGGTVTAGTPMLLKLNADVEEVSFYNAEALKNDGNLNVQPTDATVNGKTDVTIQYSGTYMKKTDCESVYSFNVDATFGKHNGGTLNPFRAYLTIVDASGNAVQNASFYSSLNPGGGTTGINGVAADTVGAKAAIYSIDGKLVRKAGDSKSLAKGVYIIGGKKLVVK